MATNGKLHLEQVGPHLYDLYTRNGILLCRVFMGNDGQYIKDAAALQEIGKALVKRWGL